MKGHVLSLFVGALALVATALPAQAQLNVCFTTLSGVLTADVTLDDPSDIFEGTGSGATTYQVSGGRGNNGRTLRHHYFDFMNPAAGDDPSCSDGAGVVDWLVFNGRVTGGGGGTYSWGGYWQNSCGSTGSTTGTIEVGVCPAQRPAVLTEADPQRAPETRAQGLATDVAAPLVAALPEGGVTYCYTNDVGYEHEGVLDLATGILSGPGDSGSERYVHGGRGTTNREVPHHTFVWQNPNANDDPGCDDGTGSTDWFTYNGLVTGGAGGSYTYNAAVRSSCGFTGTRNGTITLGACPPSRRTLTPGPEALVPQDAGAAEAAAAGVAVVSGPNPFRSSTTIIFALAEAAHVRLAVYDVLGREVAVLVDEERPAGSHSAVFEAGTLPAGTYVYRIEAGSYTEAKPMVLVR